jgi:hypothetical protein
MEILTEAGMICMAAGGQTVTAGGRATVDLAVIPGTMMQTMVKWGAADGPVLSPGPTLVKTMTYMAVMNHPTRTTFPTSSLGLTKSMPRREL